jgi:hypothetical protein
VDINGVVPVGLSQYAGTDAPDVSWREDDQ